MTLVPAGIFLMGAEGLSGNPEERPAHEAIVAAYFLDTTEVTVSAYRQCVTAGACSKTRVGRQFCDEEAPKRESHPINCIDLRQAAAYCAWAGKRLPSEREWEYAASGGDERRRFSWGAEDPTEKNSCYHHPFGSCPVASFAPGAFGLYDMTGNVWEWTQSVFLPYPSRAKLDPIDDKKQFVYRGGSWSRRFPKWMRNELRNRYQPLEWSASIGVRCAQSLVPMSCPPETAEKDGECVRVSGKPLQEGNAPGKPSGPVATVQPMPSSAAEPSATAAPSSTAASKAITRSRTPQHDADCQKNWPKTPFSYIFEGGENYPSRTPTVAAAGCVPRDMSWHWTSACCKQ